MSEGERAILKRAAAGDINNLTPGELEKALVAIERNNNAAINKHQQLLKRMPKEGTGNLGPLLDVVPRQNPSVRKYNPTTGLIE